MGRAKEHVTTRPHGFSFRHISFSQVQLYGYTVKIYVMSSVNMTFPLVLLHFASAVSLLCVIPGKPEQCQRGGAKTTVH